MAPPGHRGFLAGTASGFARRPDAPHDRRTVFSPDATETRGRSDRGRRATALPPGPARSSLHRTICRLRTAATPAAAAPRRQPPREPFHARAAAGRATSTLPACRETGSAMWRYAAPPGHPRSPPRTDASWYRPATLVTL